MTPGLQLARQLAEAANAVDLRPIATGGFSMRIGETPVRWRREATEIYANARRPTTISFAAGAPEPTVDVPIPMPPGTPVFVSTHRQVDPIPWLTSDGFRLIERLNLGAEDHLAVGTNQSFLRMHQRPTIADDGRAVAAFAALVEALPPSSTVRQAVRLPDAVKVLEPFIEAWAIRDDDERIEAVAAASDADLGRLWRTVEPLIPTINVLLDDGGDLDPAARTAGHLGLAALEAQAEVERRHKG